MDLSTIGPEEDALRRAAIPLNAASMALAAVLILTAVCCGHVVHQDIEYAVADGISLRLDLYLPEAPEGLAPLVLWVHGGGWRAGSKDPTYAPEALGEAYAVASIDYRLSQEAVFPAQIHDVKAAVRFLRGNAETYGLDPERFGAWGSSAGGHLVALLGTTCGVPDAEGTLGDHLDQSSRVQAVCDFFGPTNFLVLLDERGGRDMRRSMPEDQLLGGPVEENVELATLASPISHVDPSDPPFLIMHGSDDSTVPVEQSIAFDEALRAVGVDSTLIVIEGAGHGFPREHWSHVKPFFDRQLQATSDRLPASAGESANVAAAHRSGQTFITWTETGASAYGIYRTPNAIAFDRLPTMDPLAIVGANSGRNARASEVEQVEKRFVIVDRGDPLPEGTGLYIHTAEQDAEAVYAVAALDETGRPVAWIGSVGPVRETVDQPRPVLQSTTLEADSVRMHFVHWAPHGGADDPNALCNRAGQSFNFIVRESIHRASASGAVFLLHGGGGDYDSQAILPDHPDLLLVSPESVIPDTPREVDRTWDAWYGYNENVGTGQSLSDGLNVDYTTRRLRYMVEWLVETFTSIDPNRIFLRGSSMGGVGTVFSAIMLRDLFAGGVAIVPRFDYGADDIPPASQLTFATRWGPFEENVLSSDGMGVLDRLDAGFLAQSFPAWDFAPVWIFNGRNDEAVGWSEKIPFYGAMQSSGHGWAFFWDERAHGGDSTHPRAWRENGTEEAVFDWMVANVRLDQSYPAFSNGSLDDDPGDGHSADGDLVGTINGWLRWDASSIEDTDSHWAIDLTLAEGAPRTNCTVDVTARRRQAFLPPAGAAFYVDVRSVATDEILLSSQGTVDAQGLVAVREVPVVFGGMRLTIRRNALGH